MARTGTVEHYRSEGAELARRSFPDLGGKLRFVAGHPVATVKTFGVLLGANLLASSGFTHSPELIAAAPRLSRAFTLWSRVLNAVMVPVHLAGLWLLVRALRNRAQQGKGLLLALAALNYSVLALAALSYWQGDRLILTALPAWLVLYPALGWAAHVARRSQPPLAGGARAA